MNSLRKRILSAKLIIVPIAIAYIGLAYLALQRGNSLLIGIVLVLLSMIPFLLRFERRERKARELMLIAVMAAVASVSRIPFAALLPGFTPVTFVVIVSGIVFGAEAGWMVGAATALVSNFFLGQGSWTPWQMFAWGMAGYTAGLFAHRSLWRRRRLPLALFGAAWGFLFGWIMNVTLALDQWMQTRSWEAVMGKYVTGLPFEVIHAGANVFFILVFSPSWIALLERYRRKYGVLERLETAEEEEEEPNLNLFREDDRNEPTTIVK
jgi:energy-coupling factor transport system substrate-specific component